MHKDLSKLGNAARRQCLQAKHVSVPLKRQNNQFQTNFLLNGAPKVQPEMITCAIETCVNNNILGVCTTDVTFHRFPRDPSKKSVWLKATGRRNFVPTIHHYLCSLHFDVDCFYTTPGGERKLYMTARPTLLLPEPANDDDEGGVDDNLPEMILVQCEPQSLPCFWSDVENQDVLFQNELRIDVDYHVHRPPPVKGDTFCRLCFCEDEDDLISLDEATWREEKLRSILNHCVPIRDDDYPPYVCRKCAEELIFSFIFLDKCRRAYHLMDARKQAASQMQSAITKPASDTDSCISVGDNEYALPKPAARGRRRKSSANDAKSARTYHRKRRRRDVERPTESPAQVEKCVECDLCVVAFAGDAEAPRFEHSGDRPCSSNAIFNVNGNDLTSSVCR